MMLDDCLASFGIKLDEPWDSQAQQHLFELGKLYAQCVKDAPFSDLLGGVYQTLASRFNKKGMGQYFTPDAIAKMMAQINYRREDFETKPVIRFYEPTAGSGVLALAFMAAARQDNPDFLGKLSVTMIDLDRLCVKMAVLQVMANNLIHTRNLGEIRAYHGNSLGDPKDLKLFYHASTPTYDAAAKSQPPDEKETPKYPKGQVDLFDLAP